MNSPKFQFWIHDESDKLRFKLAGSLSGAGVESVYQAWQTSLSIIGARPLVVEMTLIDYADERGRGLLVAWHRCGARIIAASPESRALAEAALGEPFPEAHPEQGWIRGLRGFLFRCATVALQTETHRRTRFS